MLDIVFIKETFQFSRRFTTYLFRFFYILVIFVFIALIYSGQLGDEMNSSLLETKLEAFGRNLYYLLAWVQIVLTVVLTPVVVCNAFVSETRENTLQLIQLTGLSDRSIVLGKVLGKFLSLFLMILTGLPVLFFAKLFGFIDFQLIIGNFANCLSLMLITGGIAAFYGLTNAKLTTALSKTLGTLFIMQVALLFAGLFLRVFDVNVGTLGYGKLLGMPLSPVYNQIMLSTTRAEEGIPNVAFYIIVFVEFWISFVIFWYFILKAERQYRWWSLGLIAFSGSALKSQTVKTSTPQYRPGIGRMEPIAKIDPVKSADVKTFDMHRVLAFSKVAFPILISIIVLIWLAMVANKDSVVATSQYISGIQTLLTIFVAFTVIWVSFSLASEKENRTLDVLLSTPISNKKIIQIALKSFWDCTKFSFIAIGVGLLFGAASTDLNITQGLNIWLTVFLFVLFFIALSLYFSATSESASKAIVKSTIFATAIMILPMILSELFYLVDFNTVGAIITILSPYELINTMAYPTSESSNALQVYVGAPSMIIAAVMFTYSFITFIIGLRMFKNLRYILQEDT